MANKINLKTGETYTLSYLFSGDKKVIIPDLQRDYCWGDDASTEKGELVTDFVNNLIEQYDSDSQNTQGTLNLGLFYGYEVPTNHIQLCDGQQRLTTLYLLLGMLNKKMNNKLCYNLIYDFENKQDDKGPYLNYYIRETSHYFMSDLVLKFFIGNKDTVESIKDCDWYFSDYNLDPSIKSMLRALSIIESLLKNKNETWCCSFGKWLLNNVTFLYFNMENRKNGEETFVVINTTGESLSATQNLKPLVINAEINKSFNDVAEKWEEIETWFWRRRQGSNDTADAGLAEFMRWISVIEQVNVELPKNMQSKDTKWLAQTILQGKNKSGFPYKTTSFETIYTYWKALKWIDERSSEFIFVNDLLSPSINNDVNKLYAIGQNQCFVLLPLLKFVYLNINKVTGLDFHRNARRIYEFFKNLIRISDVSKAVNALTREAIRIIDLLEKGDIVSLLKHANDVSKQILTEEEKHKFDILLKHLDNRTKVEEAFWNVQEHPIWNGEIMPIIRWSSSNGGFNLDNFLQYDSKFREIFTNNGHGSDILRRALLTIGLKDYPRIFKGYTNFSFGWDLTDWHTLINDNVDKFKDFFDNLIDGVKCETMINNYKNKSDVWYYFVSMPGLLDYCKQKNIQKWQNSFILISQQRLSSPHAELYSYILFLHYKTNNSLIPINGWNTSYPPASKEDEHTCVLFEKKISNDKIIVIKVYFNSNNYTIDLFLKAKDESEKQDVLAKRTLESLKKIAVENNLIWNDNTCHYTIEILEKDTVYQKIECLLKTVFL
ncbi:MAG: DUF262 domain-containing protein [Bacteroidales bacterium]|jgi:hypothetical protein|nr:DUF262 domain-containing protein [Bacteroidales bacterium]